MSHLLAINYHSSYIDTTVLCWIGIGWINSAEVPYESGFVYGVHSRPTSYYSVVIMNIRTAWRRSVKRMLKVTFLVRGAARWVNDITELDTRESEFGLINHSELSFLIVHWNTLKHAKIIRLVLKDQSKWKLTLNCIQFLAKELERGNGSARIANAHFPQFQVSPTLAQHGPLAAKICPRFGSYFIRNWPPSSF